MAVSLPTSTDVRRVRNRAGEVVNTQFDLVRAPVLAWIGVGDLAVHTLRELPQKLGPDELRKRANDAADRARDTYDEWVRRGEDTVARVRRQPQVARALRTVEDANHRFDERVDNMVDDLHDVGENALGVVTSRTRSTGEKVARRTQRAARDAAREVNDASDELAEAVTEAGDEAAHEARSVSRKAANRTAPAGRSTGSATRSGASR
jgi:heparin binding hemagglutinin HbhA